MNRLRLCIAAVRNRLVRRRFVVAIASIGLLICGWFGVSWLLEELEVGKSPIARVRAHLVEAMDGARERALVQSERVSSHVERRRLRHVATATHVELLSSVDWLTHLIVNWEAIADADEVVRELARRVREDDVDAALAFIDAHRGDILKRARSREASVRQRNLIELRPLLIAAVLEASRGQPDKARQQFEEVVAVEHDWPTALECYGWFLASQIVPQAHSDLDLAWKDATRFLELAERLPNASQLSVEQARLLPLALNQLARAVEMRGFEGCSKQAHAYRERALEISDQILADHPDSPRAASDVVATLHNLAGFLTRRGASGDFDQAMEYYQRCLDVSEHGQTLAPELTELWHQQPLSFVDLAGLLCKRRAPGDTKRALEHYERACQISEQQWKAAPKSAEAAYLTGVSSNRLATYMSRGPGRRNSQMALKHYQRALQIGEELLTSDPDSTNAAHLVATTLDNLGSFLSRRSLRGDREQATEYLQRSLELNESLYDIDRHSLQHAGNLSISLIDLGQHLMETGLPNDKEQAIKHFQRALEIAEQCWNAHREFAQFEYDVASSLNRLAWARMEMSGDAEQALPLCQRNLEISERLQVANPNYFWNAGAVAWSLLNAADALEIRNLLGDTEEAHWYALRSLRIGEQLLADTPESTDAAMLVAVSSSDLADSLLRRGSPGDKQTAMEYYDRCLQIFRRLLAEDSPSAERVHCVIWSHTQLVRFGHLSHDVKLIEYHQAQAHALLHQFISAGATFDQSMMDLYTQLHNPVRTVLDFDHPDRVLELH